MGPGNTCITNFTGSIRGHDLALSGCGTGIQTGRTVDLTRLTWSGGSYGVISKRVKLVDSSVTGGTALDIASGRFPRLLGTTCDHSFRLASAGTITAETWGVCGSD